MNTEIENQCFELVRELAKRDPEKIRRQLIRLTDEVAKVNPSVETLEALGQIEDQIFRIDQDYTSLIRKVFAFHGKAHDAALDATKL